jgi:hypothetical protein
MEKTKMEIENIIKKLITIAERIMEGADTNCGCQHCMEVRSAIYSLQLLQLEMQEKKRKASLR